jgi:hypothetical protein
MAVSPLTGKTHPRYLRIIVQGDDISGDMRAINAFGATFEQADATGWSNGTRQWLTGQANVMLDGLTAIFNNAPGGIGPAYKGSHTRLSAMNAVYASVFVGIRAAPAIGNPSFSAGFGQHEYTVNGDVNGSDPVMLGANFYQTAELLEATAVWGVCLANGTELSGTTNNGSVDNGAATSAGYIAILHVTQTTGAIGSNTWAFKIEHSTNDSTWADLATFTLNGSALAVERAEASGTVNRYVRFVATRTAGTAAPWVSFIRK